MVIIDRQLPKLGNRPRLDDYMAYSTTVNFTALHCLPFSSASKSIILPFLEQMLNALETFVIIHLYKAEI